MPQPPPYLLPYITAVDRVGPTFEALLWTSPESQAARFDALARAAHFADAIVLDAGCGRADLAAWLLHKKVRFARYIGLEGVQVLARSATDRNLPRSLILHTDFVADHHAFTPRGIRPDVIIFSGSLNTLHLPDAAAVLRRAWDAAAAAVVFNFLADQRRQPPPAAPLPVPYKFPPLHLLRLALSLTPFVHYDCGYLADRDATIAMHKSAPSTTPT